MVHFRINYNCKRNYLESIIFESMNSKTVIFKLRNIELTIIRNDSNWN